MQARTLRWSDSAVGLRGAGAGVVFVLLRAITQPTNHAAYQSRSLLRAAIAADTVSKAIRGSGEAGP